MGKQLHLDPAAEREATDIGVQFMHSSDVVGDMSRAYGTDLSSIRLHTDESAARAAAERGVDAYSTGKDIFFARGAFDRNDPASRGLLAHELSHSLQQGAGGSPAAVQDAPMGAEQGGFLDWFRSLFRARPKPEDEVRFTAPENTPTVDGISSFFRENNSSIPSGRYDDPRRRELYEQISARLSDSSIYGHALADNFRNASGTVNIRGFNASRTISGLRGALGSDMSVAQVGELYEKLLGGGRYAELRTMKENGKLTPETQAEMDRYTPEQIAQMDARFDEGMLQMKGLQLAQLRRLKNKYGVYGSQMHPEDFITRVGPEFFSDIGMLQDSEQMLTSGGRYFDFENNAEDREYRALSNYYNDVYGTMQSYASTDQNTGNNGIFSPGEMQLDFFKTMDEPKRALATEAEVRSFGAQGFTAREQRGYEGRVRKRFKKAGLMQRLFGRFL